jgi:tetratricopeptide (TPR) repeat protein
MLPCLLALASCLAQAVDKGMLEQAQSLIRAGKAEAAYQLLEAKEAEQAGEPNFDYLLATAALESGKPSKASFVYERILAVDPSYLGVRADMGRAYFALGDYARAKIEFETVLGAKNLPLDLRTQVEQYAAAADAKAQAKQTVTTGYMEFGLGRDSNIGSASGLTSMNLPATGIYRPTPPTGVRTADGYGTVALGGEVNHLLSDQWGLFAGADYRIRDYAKFNDANNWTLDGRAGVSYSGGAWLLRTGLTAGEYHYNQQRLRESVGATVDWRMALSTSSQLTAGGSLLRATYVPVASSSQQSDTYTGTVGWMQAVGDGSTVFSLSGVAGYEDAFGNRDDGDRRFWGPRVLVQTSFTKELGGYVTAGVSRSTYRGINSSYLVSRRETAGDMTFALNWTFAKGMSLRPQVSYIRNNSNTELYAYDKADASLNLRFDY